MPKIPQDPPLVLPTGTMRPEALSGWVGRLPQPRASLFSVVLGVAGMGGAWRVANRVWNVPGAIGESLMGVGVLVWSVLIVLYAAKWLSAPGSARAEVNDPVQGNFVGLVGVATMLIAGAILPYIREVALVLGGFGAVVAGSAVWAAGVQWRGGRDVATITPASYLPTVAGSFVFASLLAAWGAPTWGQLVFGAGLFSWLAIESVLLNRLSTAAELPVRLRPSLGIQLAPPTVGAVTYLTVAPGAPGIMAQALLGYGLLQAFVLVRQSGWIRQEPFGASYWSFSFGLTALATAPLLMIEQGETGAVTALAPWLLGLATLAIAGLLIRMAVLLAQGRLRTQATPDPVQPLRPKVRP